MSVTKSSVQRHPIGRHERACSLDQWAVAVITYDKGAIHVHPRSKPTIHPSERVNMPVPAHPKCVAAHRIDSACAFCKILSSTVFIPTLLQWWGVAVSLYAVARCCIGTSRAFFPFALYRVRQQTDKKSELLRKVKNKCPCPPAPASKFSNEHTKRHRQLVIESRKAALLIPGYNTCTCDLWQSVQIAIGRAHILTAVVIVSVWHRWISASAVLWGFPLAHANIERSWVVALGMHHDSADF